MPRNSPSPDKSGEKHSRKNWIQADYRTSRKIEEDRLMLKRSWASAPVQPGIAANWFFYLLYSHFE
jgi:hypothetical protein